MSETTDPSIPSLYPPTPNQTSALAVVDVVLDCPEEATTGEEDLMDPGGGAGNNGTCTGYYTTYNTSHTSNTTASNNATNTGPGGSYYFYETEQFTVLWLLFISIVVGNVAVIAALMLSKTRKSRTNFFIMHLALADLSVGLISVLTDIVWKSTVSWHAGNFGCKAVRFAQVVVTYSSTYVLVALSIDRYDAITHPMNFSGSWRRARRLVVVAWLLSAVFASPSLVFFMEAPVDGIVQCWIDFSEPWQWKVYMTMVALTVFVFPTIIITACYAIIVYTIWSKSKIMTVGAKAVGARNGDKRGEEDTRRASSRGLIPKAKIKTVKMTLVIVFVFVLCWSPYIVFDLLQVYGFVPKTQTNIAVATFIQSLAPLNSAANPIIYCLFSTHICRNLRQKWSTTKTTFTNSSKNTSGGVGGSGSVPVPGVLPSTTRRQQQQQQQSGNPPQSYRVFQPE